MNGGIWPLEQIRAAVVSVDFDRLVLDGITAAAGLPAVVVDVGDDPADDVGAALAAIPIVSVAVGAGGESWDMALDDPGPALEGLRANPQAAVVATQTLRRGGRLGLLDGLLVESLAYATLQAGPEHARWLAELSMGLIPGAGGTVSIPARIGRQRTLWWLLTGAELDAATALDWRLVDGIA